MYIVIVNSHSGKRRYNFILKQLSTFLHKPFLTYIASEYQEETMWIEIDNKLLDLKGQVKGFIIIGGDGTLHYTVQKLYHHNLPFGVIPSGSGNDFGRALKIPKNTKKAILRINQQNINKYDLLEINGKKVLSIIGIGVDAETAIHCQTSRIKRLLNMAFLGRLTYLAVFLKTVFRYRSKDITINNEEGCSFRFKRVWLMALGNTSYYGGGIPICPSANPQDGKIHVVIVHNLNIAQLLLALPTVFFKKHLSLPYVKTLEGRSFTISTENIPIQGDGEELGVAPATINILHKAIEFY
ncbi:diacylglycerol/lipid kinase family protein [Evansella cellulosilytica]|uniref:Diacylglycerol kinase catalytic region n=1 Tax=Evansella cellulosilytica (strain ATCC 21833 / DSM 2522 / FERM P-1141 / JCM 9156 / N-4) TaxID=649639 RepID=E6U081_EVAC2|nr:YegS/Rv2252/BmrU family lipid kinase [Evansella cellulosilytica]ADU30197.1 diacylglycerol kinase catalytic region [Evansella cellulosilytica DSM 2522]